MYKQYEACGWDHLISFFREKWNFPYQPHFKFSLSSYKLSNYYTGHGNKCWIYNIHPAVEPPIYLGIINKGTIKHTACHGVV